MKKLPIATLLLLIKRNDGQISHICLAMKKRGFGMGKWNGVGGKIEDSDSSIESAAKREAREEIGVGVNLLTKVAILDFFFPNNSSWDQRVYVYLSDDWTGDPTESEEMLPRWFKVGDIPYQEMWSDDVYWLPLVLKGKLVKAKFTFGEGDQVTEKFIKLLKEL